MGPGRAGDPSGSHRADLLAPDKLTPRTPRRGPLGKVRLCTWASPVCRADRSDYGCGLIFGTLVGARGLRARLIGGRLVLARCGAAAADTAARPATRAPGWSPHGPRDRCWQGDGGIGQSTGRRQAGGTGFRSCSCAVEATRCQCHRRKARAPVHRAVTNTAWPVSGGPARVRRCILDWLHGEFGTPRRRATRRRRVTGGWHGGDRNGRRKPLPGRSGEQALFGNGTASVLRAGLRIRRPVTPWPTSVHAVLPFRTTTGQADARWVRPTAKQATRGAAALRRTSVPGSVHAPPRNRCRTSDRSANTGICRGLVSFDALCPGPSPPVARNPLDLWGRTLLNPRVSLSEAGMGLRGAA